MDYEKAYKEALERARKSHDKSNGFIKKEWIETIFPELKESEEERDEKIRKEIISIVKSYRESCITEGNHRFEECLTWLAKQGEADEIKAKKFLINKGYPIDTNGTFPTYEEMYNIIGGELKNHHEWVDLGLPSGTKWAICNIGATKPEEYGDYFAWGETAPKKIYTWNTYKHAHGNYDKLTKYCDNSAKYGNDGFSDNKHTLDPEDDAARVSWGNKWCMPTAAQQEELLNECYCVWTDNYNGSGIKGWIIYKAKGASDKGVRIGEGESSSASYIYTLYDTHIFLPTTGYRCNDDTFKLGAYGNYWSSSQDNDNPCNACKIFLYPNNVYCTEGGFRPTGYTIRPVLNQEY